MKRLIACRPSPATVMSAIALFVALGGVSYGFATGSIDTRELKNNDVRSGDLRDNSVRTEDLRNNTVRAVDIRNSTVRGRDIALNTLTGNDIAEDKLGKVPSAAGADTVGNLPPSAFARSANLIPFSVRLADNEERQLASNGQVSVSAKCLVDPAGDTVRLLAKTTVNGTIMRGFVDHPGDGGTPFLEPLEGEANRALLEVSDMTGAIEVGDGIGGGAAFVMGPDGKAIHVSPESTVLALNYGAVACRASGLLVATG